MNLFITISDQPPNIHDNFLDDHSIIVCYSHVKWEHQNLNVLCVELPENNFDFLFKNSILSLLEKFNTIIICNSIILQDPTKSKYYLDIINNKNFYSDDHIVGFNKKWLCNTLFGDKLPFESLNSNSVNALHKSEAMFGRPVPPLVAVEMIEEIIPIHGVFAFSHSNNKNCDDLSAMIYERYKNNNQPNTFLTSNSRIFLKNKSKYDYSILVTNINEEYQLEIALKRFITNTGLSVCIYSNAESSS